MAITAAAVKELRERTGAGMMDCKKALTEADGDMKAAIEILRTKGLAAASKKAHRKASEGAVMVVGDAATKVVLELNCETDFVARNPKFQDFARALAEQALASVRPRPTRSRPRPSRATPSHRRAGDLPPDRDHRRKHRASRLSQLTARPATG
jgi:translation elongation factor Ts